MSERRRRIMQATETSPLNFTSASVSVQLELVCWPVSAAQKAFATILVVLKCQRPTLFPVQRKKEKKNPSNMVPCRNTFRNVLQCNTVYVYQHCI